MTQYVNLEIRILKQDEQGYPVELTLDSEQQFRGGYLAPEILPWVGGVSLEEDGKHLFKAFFADETLRQQWERIRGQTPQRRIRLSIDDTAPELHTIPWELLRDADARLLAAGAATPFSRYLAGEWQSGQPILARPIKIAVAIANPENLPDYEGLAAIAVEEEWAILETAAKGLEVDLVQVSQPCTLAAIEEAIKAGCHILHLIAHGRYSQRQGGALIYLADDQNKVAVTSGADFAAMVSRLLVDMGQNGPLRLVFLATCQSATQSPADAFRGLAPQLIQAGLPAVVAMQDLIPVKTAQAFTRAFYGRLLHHGLVDLAGNEARAALLTEKLPGSGLPVLVSRLFDNQLLAPSLLVQEQAYRKRLKARYGAEAAYYIELSGETTEAVETPPPPAAPRSIRRRRVRPEYHEWVQAGQELKRVRLDTLREGVDKYPCIILLGDPGSGKTTALEHLAYQFAGEAGKLPVPLRLSQFEAGMSVEGFIRQTLRSPNDRDAPELATHLTEHLAEGRLFILFDALNEMPRREYKERAQALRDFIDRWSKTGNHFLVTCRVLDYGEELSGLRRVEVQPLNDDQIRTFLQAELPDSWPSLWNRLTESDHPIVNRKSQIANRTSRRLLEMARNPYILTMMIDVYLADGDLGHNRAALLTRFSQILFEREKAKTPLADWLEAEVQQFSLAQMAFGMQKRAGSGAAVATTLVKTVMPAKVQLDPAWPAVPAPPDQVLALAARANLIEMPVDRSLVRFYHQLLQEYFAAHELLKRSRDLSPGTLNSPPLTPPREGRPQASPPSGGTEGGLPDLWRWPWLESEMPLWERPEENNDPLPPPPPTGWEETTILAAGLVVENDYQLIQALTHLNPVLAGRCLHQGRARVDPPTRRGVIAALLKTIRRPEVALRVRIAAGEVLGDLGDPRLGAMVTIPAGKFIMEEDEAEHMLQLPAYQLGQYPLTNAEFAPFIEAGGYDDQQWWTEAGWAEKSDPQYGNQPWTEPRFWRDARFNKPNQPLVGVSWYEALAYCRWLSAERGRLYRLPSEAEWEKGARGTDGRRYPWGNDFDEGRLNVREGAQQVRATTPVGIYPGGVSPFEAYDCAGNVWEWCATKWDKRYPYDVTEAEWEAEYLDGTGGRVLRGGSWYDYRDDARCAVRNWDHTLLRNGNYGFRLVSPI